MGKYRAPRKKTKYYLPKEDYLTAIHYSLRYPLWKEELDSFADTSKAITYDKERVQTSNNYDSTFEAAIRISESEMAAKVKLIDDTITLTAKGQDYYLRLGVCYGLTFEQLKSKGLPYEKDAYYEMRRHYYYELLRKI